MYQSSEPVSSLGPADNRQGAKLLLFKLRWDGLLMSEVVTVALVAVCSKIVNTGSGIACDQRRAWGKMPTYN